MLRVRMSAKDAHYAGGLVDGAAVLALFGDAATELLIRHDGDEGLFVAYDSIEFLSPVYAGDFLEVTATMVSVGNTSRKISFLANKVISLSQLPHQPSAADVLPVAVPVCRASGTCVVPATRQRHGRE
jgi:3-aminobutyryl-CoA ammonia-lyase